MKRENNLDLLKILACIMVIIIHVSAYYVLSYEKTGGSYFTIGNLWDSFARPAVPIFILLAGKYALSNEKNIEIDYYYKKILKNIYIPTFIYSSLYFVYSYFLIIIKYILNFEIKDKYSPVKKLIIGVPFYHLWYLYMAIGLYLLVPFLIRLRIKIGEKIFRNIGIFFIFLGFVTLLLQNYLEQIDFYNREDILKYLRYFWIFNQFKFINYLGYFMLGYSLKDKKINFKVGIIGALISLLVMFFVVEVTKNQFYYSNNFLFVISASVLLYLSFLNLKIDKNISLITKKTFSIYLLHAGILNIIQLFFKYILKYEINPLYGIPVLVVVVFIISYAIASIIEKFKLKYLGATYV
ncbi:acyltransferase [Fusobacterium mortiferum]|uniref:acyltransferase n=1 Tax=Fusobacterium mortiferum TaxID=850 RepID=UPI001589FBB4|nr:acyltransferase family protein [Fusobacterium mortiferum]